MNDGAIVSGVRRSIAGWQGYLAKAMGEDARIGSISGVIDQ